MENIQIRNRGKKVSNKLDWPGGGQETDEGQGRMADSMTTHDPVSCIQQCAECRSVKNAEGNVSFPCSV